MPRANRYHLPGHVWQQEFMQRLAARSFAFGASTLAAPLLTQDEYPRQPGSARFRQLNSKVRTAR